MPCGTKLSAKGARAYELSRQLELLQREAGMVPFPDVSKLSAIAAELERRFPSASVGEIYAMAKPTVENAIAVVASQSRPDGISWLVLDNGSIFCIIFEAYHGGYNAKLHTESNSFRTAYSCSRDPVQGSTSAYTTTSTTSTTTHTTAPTTRSNAL